MRSFHLTLSKQANATLCLVALLATTVALGASNADILDAYDGDVYRWPTKARPDLNVAIKQRMIDGGEVSEVIMSGPATIIMPFADYIPAEGDDPRYSATLRHRINPALRIHVSIFGEGEFLPAEIDREAVIGYAKGLVDKKPGAPGATGLTIVNNLEEVGTFTDYTFVGGPPFYIHTRSPAAGGAPATDVLHYFIPREGKLIVLSFEAPADLMARNRSAIRRLFGFTQIP